MTYVEEGKQRTMKKEAEEVEWVNHKARARTQKKQEEVEGKGSWRLTSMSSKPQAEWQSGMPPSADPDTARPRLNLIVETKLAV